MAKKFDVAVIGTGTAASTVATACRSAGWQVAVIDSRPFGGTCALRGCDPKKVLVGAAEIIDWTRRMQGKGIHAEQARIDWRELMRFKRSFTDPVPQSREQGFAKAGIAAFHGRARFVGPQEVRVGEENLTARYVLVATGARPVTLHIPGENLITTSDQFLELETLPRRIVFVGGGYISFEFAHVSVRAGAEVTLLHRGARPLAGFDPDLVEQLVKRTRELGVDLRLETRVEAIERVGDHLSVRASTQAGAQMFEADLVVHGAGRVAEIDDLDLSAAGVAWGERGVKVNEYLQSVSNPTVYAAGDAAASSGLPLTPVAGYEGRVAAENILSGNRRKTLYEAIPTVVYTVPPLASVGWQERAARDKGLRFRVHREDTSWWYSSRRIGETCSGSKVLIEEGSDRILGAHMLGPQADDLINLFTLAMSAGTKAADLREVIFGYPTHGSDVQYMV
ncbi:MAG: NAD(P)/FAD-dependent oxidoreductase [Acidobacteriia bacterium]|nr:NAD(P)/FAD-dependent oxidoreductase [Terriglobia bacterium]